ncbi:hypothetical protein KUCAC02_029933 [Chaenocephalus aceratus]|uniref:Uncharacterized protein n=1 Tax=Chaenocephalus aceratus TaxID=36190 RepID=A0ACB9XIB6_CHAAC|nr:hypothetical protein KUCAC02_029933 [Chaenocephalus aceratus]
MEQLKYAEMRARQQHFQQIQHQQHQAGGPHANQAAPTPPSQGPTAEAAAPLSGETLHPSAPVPPPQ